MPEITNQIQLASSKPEEAVQNIDDSRIFNMSPDTYKEHKEFLQPEADLLKVPSVASKGLATYSSISSEHASLVKNNITDLSKAETLFTTAKEKIDGVDLEQKVNTLRTKKELTPKNFTQDDEMNLFMMETDLKERRNFTYDKPGKHDETVNKFLEKQKETSFIDDSINALGAGAASTIATTAKIPSLLYDAYFYPANLIRSFRGEPEITAPESLKNNPVAKNYTEMAKAFNEQVPMLNKDVTDAVANGDFVEAGQIAALKFLNNFPQQATLIASGLTGVPALGLAQAGLASATQANEENQAKGLSPTQSLPNALAKGTIEAAFENLGTLGMLKTWETALTNSFGKNSARMVILNTVKSITHSALGEGIEEGATSYAQDITDYVSGVNRNALVGINKRALEAATVGAVSGGLLTGPAAIGKAAGNIQQHNIIQKNQQLAVDMLNFDSAFTNALNILKESDVGRLSPAEMSQVAKSMLDEAGIKNVYLDKETLSKWADNPDKAARVRNIIDPSGEAAAALNAPIKVEAHKFLELRGEFPEVGDLYSLTPEGPTVQKATDYLNSVQEASDKRMALLDKLQVPNPTLEDIKMVQEALNTEQPSAIYPSSDVFGEQQYLDQTNLEKALEPIMPENERTKYLADQLKAKQQIVDHINESAEYEMNQVMDVAMSEMMELEKEAQLQRLENNPNLAIVDKYTQPIVPEQFAGLEELQTPHHKEGYSAFAIDPRTLPENLKGFLKDPQLKKNKVFVKGGIDVNTAAGLLGVTNGETLLSILSQTPNREEIATKRAEARRADIEAAAKESIGLNELGITKAYDARLTNALETMKIMKDKFWPSTKTGFKRIALTPPTSRELISQAKDTVSKTLVGDLNVTQFKVGERKSERIAVDAILKNQAEKAFVNQLAVAKNIALAQQTQIAIGEVNRVIKLARKFNKSSVIQELKDAGPIYEKAAKEILEVYNLTSKKGNTEERNSFTKWVKQMSDKGQGEFVIPERLQDQRASLNEMTVEQVRAAGDALKNILHEARYKNKLYTKFEKIKGIQTLERIGNLVEENAKKIFDYDLKRAEQTQTSLITPMQKAGEWLLDFKNFLERPQHIIVKLDDGKANGFFNDLLYRPLVEADNNKKTLLNDTRIQLEKIIDKFGREEFENLNNELIIVDEFKNIPGMNNGQVSKGVLLSMELNFGNEGNILALERFEVTRDVIRKVLDRELNHKHTELVQNIWNMYESFKPKISDLQQRTEGTDVRWVEPKSFVARGRKYDGGYFPLFYQTNETKQKAEKLLGAGMLHQIEQFKQNYYGKAMTEQGHLEARTGSDKLIDLNLNAVGYSFNQIIHDITHREVIADGAKILSDKKIRENITAVVGPEGYGNIADTYISIAQSVEQDSYGKGDTAMLKVLNYLGGGLQTVAIAGKFTSIAIQPASLAFAIDKMGKVSGADYMLKTAHKISKNPDLIPSFVKFAEELNPSIRDFTEDISKVGSLAINELMPTKDNLLTPIKGATEYISETAFSMLSGMDKMNKVMVTLTAYQQAMEGNAPGLAHIKGDHEEAAKYASNISELTQTHNDIRNLPPAQKNRFLKYMLYFFNDLNNMYNNTLAASRAAAKEFSEATKSYRVGDIKATSLKTMAGIGTIAGFMLTMTMVKYYENILRGQKVPGDDEDNPQDFLKSVGKFYLTSPIDQFMGTIPLLRDANYASSKYWEKRKSVQLPIENAISTLTTAYSGLEKYLGFVGDTQEMNSQERKALILSVGILTHTPTGALYDYFIKPKRETTNDGIGTLANISKLIGQITEKNKTTKNIPEPFFKELNKIDAQINPQQSQIPEKTYQTLKQAQSEGNPYAYNEKTGAAGVYQFTEKEWNDLMKNEPDLGLTENGRVSGNSEQQDRAIKFVVAQDSKKIKEAGFEASTENLYGARLLGADKIVEILKAKDKIKLNTLVDKDFMENHQLPKDTTVSGFKDWLMIEILKADEGLTKQTNK